MLISVGVGVRSARDPLAMLPANEKRHDKPKKKWNRELPKAIAVHAVSWNRAMSGIHFESTHAVKTMKIRAILFQKPHMKKMRNKAAMLTG